MLHNYRNIIQFLLFVLIAMIAFRVDHNIFITEDIQTMKSVTDISTSENILYDEIKQKSLALEEDPQDAYIDRVWKKTPGRNGLKVDIEKSYEKMKKDNKFNESLIVYKHDPPKTSLKDLPPAPIYRGHPEKDMVAFLINVSWGTEHIPDILKILNENNIKATFFVEGKWAKEHASMVKMIDEQGHLIGNHAYSHPDMQHLSSHEIHEEIHQTNNVIKAIIEKTPTLLAPPSGSFKDEVVEVAHELNMETILWTVDTIDWKNPSVSVMINRVVDNIHPGAMILMHPTLPIVKGLDLMIKEIKELEYRINTVDLLLSEDR